jgi:hypothetical protein
MEASVYAVIANRQAHFSTRAGWRRRYTTNAHNVIARKIGNQIFPYVT